MRRLVEIETPLEVLLVDHAFEGPQPFETLCGDLLVAETRTAAIGNADALLHLAALPGAAAAADPVQSRRVNLDLGLRLLEDMRGRRVVIAGSIAVLGSVPGQAVNDDTIPKPCGTYATHKRMVELAVGDAVDRGDISGGVLRLPGIVARPAASGGFGSAFLSDIFHAARSGSTYRMPVGPDATSWLASAQISARNLVHAVGAEFSIREAVTLPALTIRMSDLVEALAERWRPFDVTWDEQQIVRAMFGSHSELTTDCADALGFVRDRSLQDLVRDALDDR